ncbi:MAG: hypothetical protein JSW05_07490 [Candidatus Thorarchaeota archaeon]|nr:MAG: hypothetical protein JSW05_07490 [Candidatus Thorarchaeota archaeon]
MDVAETKRRILRFFIEYGILLLILIVGLAIWVPIFNLSLQGYLSEELWINWDVWLGNTPGQFDVFGFTVNYQFEGYTDYTYFYVHWGNNILNGVMPYCDEFGHIILDGYENNNGLYIFPPLTAVFYGLGVWILPDNWGIALLLAALGFLTVFPVFGLGKELSGNRHVGEVAALTYLLAPNVLFHITYLWTNPPPFIFFFFSGFYMLVRGRRHTGTLLIVTAALFKQTAWFLGIPLVIYLIMKPRTPQATSNTENEAQKETAQNGKSEDQEPDQDAKPDRLQRLIDYATEYLDLHGFLISAVVVLIFVAAVMFPFVVAQPHFWSYMRLAAGGFRLDSFTEPPGYGSPIRLQVLPVIVGLPEFAEALDYFVFSGGLLALGVTAIAGLMVMEPKYMGQSKVYLRRILFYTLLLMLWVNLTGPRGVYKYYFTLFAPFFSIFSSATMCVSMKEKVPFSTPTIWMPLLLSITILIPHRNIYLMYVIFIFAGYIFARSFGQVWYTVTAPFRGISRRISPILEPTFLRMSSLRDRAIAYAYPEMVVPEA